jgi:hypothetical protein
MARPKSQLRLGRFTDDNRLSLAKWFRSPARARMSLPTLRAWAKDFVTDSSVNKPSPHVAVMIAFRVNCCVSPASDASVSHRVKTLSALNDVKSCQVESAHRRRVLLSARIALHMRESGRAAQQCKPAKAPHERASSKVAASAVGRCSSETGSSASSCRSAVPDWLVHEFAIASVMGKGRFWLVFGVAAGLITARQKKISPHQEPAQTKALKARRLRSHWFERQHSVDRRGCKGTCERGSRVSTRHVENLRHDGRD